MVVKFTSRSPRGRDGGQDDAKALVGEGHANEAIAAPLLLAEVRVRHIDLTNQIGSWVNDEGQLRVGDVVDPEEAFGEWVKGAGRLVQGSRISISSFLWN